MIKNLFPVPLPTAIVVKILRLAALRKNRDGAKIALPLMMIPVAHAIQRQMLECYPCALCCSSADFMWVSDMRGRDWYFGTCATCARQERRVCEDPLEVWSPELGRYFPYRPGVWLRELGKDFLFVE